MFAAYDGLVDYGAKAHYRVKHSNNEFAKGKTTTTQMCALLLRDFGAQSGGNIGTPLCEMNCNAPLGC